VTVALPTVSVVVPTHNRVDLLPLTLHTVLWQQGVDLEVLVVDDGSVDDLRRSVRELHDPRIRLLRNSTPQGVSRARNRGVAEAGGRWVAFLDDDDLWAPTKLRMQLTAAEQAGHGWSYAGAINLSEDLRLLGGAPPADPAAVVAELPRSNLVPGGCSGVVVRRELLPSNPFDPSYRHFADWDLWIRLSQLDQPVAVTEPLVGYRVHSSNASLDTAGMVAELDEIERRYGGPVDRARFYRHVARVSLRVSRYGAAVRYLSQAAASDHDYRRRDFAPDVFEVAQEAARSVRRRVSRAVLHRRVEAAPPNRPRYAAQRPWVEQARPWVDALKAYRKESGPSDGPAFRE
jgi:glycosyltransferase involved in cell wall biosynthesis